MFRRDPRSIVLDLDFNPAICGLCGDLDGSFFLGVLDGIVQEVHDDLLERIGVGAHSPIFRDIRDERLISLLCLGLHKL